MKLSPTEQQLLLMDLSYYVLVTYGFPSYKHPSVASFFISLAVDFLIGRSGKVADISLLWMFTLAMPQLQKHLLSLALLVFFIPTISRADVNNTLINCYQCHSKYDEDCQHLSVNSSTYYKPCSESKKYAGRTPFCRKIAQKIHGWGGTEVMVRKCGWVRHDQECYRVRNWDHSETVCQCFTDGCNFGSILRGSLSVILLPLLAAQVSVA